MTISHAHVDLVPGRLIIKLARLPAVIHFVQWSALLPLYACILMLPVALLLVLFVPGLSVEQILFGPWIAVYAAFFLLSVRRIIRWLRILTVGEVLILDRTQNVILRNNRRLCALSQLEQIQTGTTGFSVGLVEYSYKKFGLTLRFAGGKRLWVIESSTQEEVLSLAKTIADFAGVPQGTFKPTILP